MGRRRNVEIRGTAELKSAIGRAHAQRGQLQKDLKALRALNERLSGSSAGKPTKPTKPAKTGPARPGGITMGGE